MELLCVFASMAALFLFCAFLTLRCGLHSALAPLTALSAAVLWLTLWGMAGPLLAGAWILFAAFAALGLWALWPRKGAGPDYKKLASPGAVLFWGMTAAFAVYFFVRQPMATGFDELNLWATAVKVTKVDNSLYSNAVLGTPWAVTQNPGLPLLSYFFCFFGSYADWKIYLAYNALAFAVFAAVLGGMGFSRWRLAVPTAAVLWCVPYFFTTYNHTIYLNTVYMTSYGDIPAGLVMGGAVALWLALRKTGGPKWAVLPVLALAANTKANTFVLALVAAGIVAVDGWLLPEQRPFRKGLLRRTGFAAASFAAPLAVYYLWNVRYVGMLVSKNAETGGVGETSAALSDVVVNGIKILLGQPVEGFFDERQPQFLQAIADMGNQFWTSDGKLSMIGQGRNVVVLILLVFALAVFAAPGLLLRLRVVCAGVCSTLCFLGYNLMLALSYGFIFKPFQAESLTDYNRYIYSYYIGWFLIALACLAVALQGRNTVPATAENARPVSPWERRRALAGQGAVLLLACGMLLRLNQMVLPQLSVLGFSDSEFADRKAERAEAQLVCSYLEPEDRVFYVSQGDNGEGWFSAVFDFYPVLVDYSGVVSTMEGGGGTFGLPELEPEEEGTKKYYYHPYTAQRLDETIRENGCTVIYLQTIDDIFVESYAELFTDGLAAAQNGETLLYRVTDAGYAPVEMEVTAP